MRWINIHDVHARNIAVFLVVLQNERIEEPTLIEVEPVYLVPCSRKVGITRREMVSERTTETRDPGSVVEATLRVKFDRPVVLEMY